jgi:hypothetical protein
MKQQKAKERKKFRLLFADYAKRSLFCYPKERGRKRGIELQPSSVQISRLCYLCAQILISARHICIGCGPSNYNTFIIDPVNHFLFLLCFLFFQLPSARRAHSEQLIRSKGRLE